MKEETQQPAKETQQRSNFVTTNREGNKVIYDVPVLRYAWKKEKEALLGGLKERIKRAKSVEEANALIEKGTASFKGASVGTINKWKKVAAKRIAELGCIKNPREGHTPLETLVKKTKKKSPKK